MENWIGVGIWIIMGATIGLFVKVLVKTPHETTPGHTSLLAALGSLGAVIGGMLGVGLFSFWNPAALSIGGMAGAVVLSFFMTFVYRWGVKGWA